MKRSFRAGSFVCGVLLAGMTAADGLPLVQPEDVGLSSERLAYIDEFYGEKVRKGELAGVVTLVARHGKIAHLSAVGYANFETKQELRTDTVFRFYSMTKPVAATALMMLYQEGRFQMHEPLSKYLPEFADPKVLRTSDSAISDVVPAEREPTMQDVLRHTAGFTEGGGKDACDREYQRLSMLSSDITLAEMMKRLARVPLCYQPGTRWVYSAGSDVQARLVEVLSGMPFEQFLEERLFTPLGMRDAAFWAPPDKAKRLMAMHFPKDGKLTVVNDANGHPDCVTCESQTVNGYVLNRKRKGGSFGLVGTAEDYWRYAQMLANGGAFEGARIFSPEVVRYMARDHLVALGPKFQGGQPAGTGWGLGFAVMKDPAAAGYMSSEGTFFWHGAGTTTFWIDPKENLVVVALSQELAPAEKQLAFRSDMRALVYSALIK